jgi:hypothetical protein
MRRHIKMAALGAILALPLTVSGCGAMNKIRGGGKQTYALMPADRTPAATGVVKVSSSDDENKKLDISVQHLPRPAELDPSLTTYVVWIDPGQGHDPIPVGQLQIDKDREAKEAFTTPFSQFDLMVTAERNATPAKPSDNVVLEGRIYTGPSA